MTRGFRRAALVCGLSLSAVLLIAGGWVAASWFVSPSQVEAAAQAPPQAPIVAEIERGDLTSSEVFPASVEFADQRTLGFVVPTMNARAVVTDALVAPGETVRTGQVVAAVNGAPVFLLESPFPFYRDIGMGDIGPDVEALQRQLVTLGLLDDADGDFGARTASAVRRLYAHHGSEPPLRMSAENGEVDTGEIDGGQAGSAAHELEVYLPLGAVLTAPHLPARVRSAPLLGEVVTDSTSLVIDSAEVVVRMRVTEPDGVSVGDSVRVVVDGLEEIAGVVRGVSVTDTVAEVAEGESLAGALATVSPSIDPFPPEAVGKAATVIAHERVLASDALLVPLSAVQIATSGDAHILLSQDGQFRRIAVRVSGTSNGMAAIESSEISLKAGQKVKLG